MPQTDDLPIYDTRVYNSDDRPYSRLGCLLLLGYLLVAGGVLVLLGTALVVT